MECAHAASARDRSADSQPAHVTAYALTIVLSAFQLFLVQPILGRYILPSYGGGPAVWTTCLLVFQVLLLAGYAYAHVLSRLPTRRQALLHVTLLCASLLALPLAPHAGPGPAADDPSLEIILLLVGTAGLPYCLLSSTSPLLQHWITTTHPGWSPYRLFAVSNLGALLGLLSYPFAIEPLLSLRTQASAWSAGYALFVVCFGWCAVHLYRSRRIDDVEESPSVPLGRVSLTDVVLWTALAACSSTLLMATTNAMSQDVAAMPLLWVVPLGLYLLTFTVCFERERWYTRRVWGTLLIVALVVIGLGLPERMSAIGQILAYAITLFVCCMVCHGELARVKPARGHLTLFYLAIAAGGALGGGFVSLVAPRIFDRYWEFQVGLVATYALLGICVLRETRPAQVRGTGRMRRNRPSGPTTRNAPITRPATWGWAAGLGVLIVLLGGWARPPVAGVIATTRTFYGLLRVRETNIGVGSPVWARSLWNGQTLHGAQLLGDRLRLRPLLYYSPDSGVGVAIECVRRLALLAGGRAEAAAPLRIGVVGLGVGAIAAYGQPGDTIRFYEIDPEVERIARQHFSFLANTASTVDVVLGDARVSLEREVRERGGQRFDVLVIDAFSGDAIPVHLLTQEAFALYSSHLQSEGVVAVHVSNRNMDLRPIVAALARASGKIPLWIQTPRNNDTGALDSQWMLVTGNERVLTDYKVAEHLRPLPTSSPLLAAWTDDYSNLLVPMLLRHGWLGQGADPVRSASRGGVQ